MRARARRPLDAGEEVQDVGVVLQHVLLLLGLQVQLGEPGPRHQLQVRDLRY